jgi:surface antigen
MRFGVAGLVVVTVLLAGSGVAAAVSLGFLADTPIRRFDADDLKLMNEAVEKALSASATGTPVHWANERTSSSGEVTAERAFENSGRPCRDLRVVNRHRKLEASGIYTMCREDGQWKLAQ